MPAFGPEIAPQIVSQCQASAGEMAGAFSRAFDRPITVTIGEARPFSPEDFAVEAAFPGIIILLKISGSAALVAIPESTGLLPDWYSAPDPTGKSKLTTLAQELGMLILPDAFMPDDFRAEAVGSVARAVAAGGTKGSDQAITIELSSDGKKGTAYIILPVPLAEAVFKAAPPPQAAAKPPAEATIPGAVGADEAEQKQESAPSPSSGPSGLPAAFREAAAAPQTGGQGAPPAKANTKALPTYTRSLLKISVPLSVTLAAKRQPVGQILELGPGSIIQFDKSCEEMLDLNVNNLPIARGEAVKVGEKFGLRVLSLILPGERFKPITPPASLSS